MRNFVYALLKIALSVTTALGLATNNVVVTESQNKIPQQVIEHVQEDNIETSFIELVDKDVVDLDVENIEEETFDTYVKTVEQLAKEFDEEDNTTLDEVIQESEEELDVVQPPVEELEVEQPYEEEIEIEQTPVEEIEVEQVPIEEPEEEQTLEEEPDVEQISVEETKVEQTPATESESVQSYSETNEIIDITDKLNALMRKNAAYLQRFREKYGYVAASILYYVRVTDGGDWDIKLTDEWKFEKGKTYVYQGKVMRMDDPGNIHFGYVGAVLFSEEFVCFGAGMNNISKFGFRDGDRSTYWDDPQDQIMMRWGYSMYVEEHK